MIEIAIIIMGGIVKSRVLKLGGDHMDKLIINYLHLKYGLMIGEQTAENLKNELFNLKDKKKVLTVRGKSLENGLPKSVRVTSQDIQEALGTVTNQLIDGIKELIETVPPEIIDGLMKNGITMTGQLSQVEGLSDHIMNEVKIPIQVTANPESSTIRGIMKLFRKPELLKRVIITS
jgi:rod shape-determining protein MreB